MESLPALSLSLKLFLTICVSLALREISLSKLKLIKNYLRSTIRQSRLSDFAILSIKGELAKGVVCDEVIHKFAVLKASKLVLI